MGEWLRRVAANWDVILAFALVWAAVAVYLGPGYYFFLLYLLGCIYVIRVALKR